jgi:two-component system, sensor histidine kinase and response regulator
MPGMDGFQVAEQAVGTPELTGLTLIMLTSSGKYGNSTRARALGVSAYLTKPVDAVDLHEAICRALEAHSRPQPAARPQRLAGATAARPLQILLAEDNVVNQRVAAGLLAKRGHLVTVVNDGIEALAALDRMSVDVVLMDVQMPRMGGFEATAAIRQGERESGRHLRIVAMTAHALAGDRERCLAAGMDAYLSKPIDPAALFASVEEQLSGAWIPALEEAR